MRPRFMRVIITSSKYNRTDLLTCGTFKFCEFSYFYPLAEYSHIFLFSEEQTNGANNKRTTRS